ncbi:hypothetical protein Glove_363g24 [Diversispora epigaea]|uniref:Uncharacterized protein n=1 Tax=Diversispora epigaea TaxID=1348612 RepID=A0A397H8Y4_9GLOM|nr:hypothetical protein Glove_363g24 [Diversispora epigaea]
MHKLLVFGIWDLGFWQKILIIIWDLGFRHLGFWHLDFEFGLYKEYNIRLNRTTSGTATRPDFSCLINEIPILNSEIKSPGFTPLQQQKDKLKVQLRGRKSINQLLRTKGEPPETVLLINQGDLERINKIAENYNRRTCQNDTTTPLLQIQYMQNLPGSPQLKEIFNSKCG